MVTDTLDVQLVESSFMFSLKQLKICDPFVEGDDNGEDISSPGVEFINRLVNLEVLEVSQIDGGFRYGEQPTIRLPHLKHLAISHYHDFHLLLDCHKLVSFKTKMISVYCSQDSQTVNFLYPLSVTHLYLSEFSNLENLEKLKNLEYLNVSGFYVRKYNGEEKTAKEYPKEIIANFPNLKAISLRHDTSSYSSYSMGRDIFVNLLKERNALQREQIALTFFGIQIDAEAPLVHQPEAYRQSYGKFLHFLSQLYMSNHSKLCEPELKRVRELDYSGLLAYSRKDRAEVLLELIQKLDRIKRIRVSSVVHDEDRLIEFIKQFKQFNSLKVHKEASQLGASFYRKLAATCSSPWLTIKMEPQDSFTNFDFVFKFKNLVGLKTRKYDAGDEFVRRLFDHFDVFQFEHNVGDDDVKITKRSKTRFEFSVHSGHLKVFDNLDELLQKVNKYCRHPRRFYKDYHLHRCDCSCAEFVYCPNDSYSYNLSKECLTVEFPVLVLS